MGQVMTSRQTLGRWGKTHAADYLTANGYTILERNARTPYGEIDLVARQEAVTVFVEVKARASNSLGPPEISVTPRKQTHLLGSARAYLQAHPEWDGDWRVDVIAIQRFKDSPPEITHFENILTNIELN
jgi:putative endonuclease